MARVAAAPSVAAAARVAVDGAAPSPSFRR